MRNRLLTFGALCVAGTVGSALLSGTALLPVLIAGATGLASNIWATDLGTLWERVAQRLGGWDAVLQNADLSKAVGNAIGAVIAKTSRLEMYRDYQEPLRRLANHATLRWSELSQLPEFLEEAGLDPIRSANLSRLFSLRPAEFAEARALTPQDWARMLNILQQHEPGVVQDPLVMTEVAEILHHDFPKALREVLKEDFAKGGRAYAGLVLDLVGDLHAAFKEQQDTLLARRDSLAGVERSQLEREYGQLSAKLNELTVLNSQAFQALAPLIESGFEDVTAFLQSLRGELDGRLTSLQADITAIKKNMMAAKVQPGLLLAGQPHSSLEDWQGRKKELDWLYGKIAQGKVLLGIEGIGGLGKSTLASKLFVEPLLEASVATRVGLRRRFWVDVSSGVVFAEWARQLLKAFGATVPQEEQQLVDAVVQCLQMEPSLVVVDNLESLLTSDLEWQGPLYREFFQAWLVCGNRSAVLVTTRERPNLRGIEWLPQFQGLAPEEGAALLSAKGIAGNLTAFSETLQGHPLLLRLVADLLREEFPESPHLERLQELGLGDFSQLLKDPQVVGIHRREEVGLILVLDASYRRLSSLQQEVLQAVAVLRGAFSEQAAQCCVRDLADTAAVRRTLKELIKRSILRRVTQPYVGYAFPAVVQEYVRLQIENLEELHERAIDFYRLIALPSAEWKEIEDTRYQLEVAHHEFERQNYRAVNETLKECDAFLSLRGAYSLLVDWNCRLIDVWQPPESESKDYSWALIRLGNAYICQGDYVKAIECYEQSLGIKQAIGDHRGESACLVNLGNAHRFQGDYVKAIKYCEQSLEITREFGDRYGESICLTVLGSAYCSKGDYVKAIEYQEKSLEITRAIGDRRGEANCLIELGGAYYHKGDYVKAIKYQEKSLETSRAIGYSDGEAVCLMDLGSASSSQGHYIKAIEYYEQSFEIKQTNGDRKGEANCLIGLGVVYYSRRDYVRAIEYQEKSLGITRAIGDLKGEADCLANLGNAYYSQRQYVEAIEYYEQSFEITRAIGDRKGEANCLIGFGNLFYSQRQYVEAIEYYEQSLEVKQTIGDCNGEADCLANLGNAYYPQGHYVKAIEYYEQSLGIKQTIGDQNGEAIVWFNLGNCLTQAVRVPDALSAYSTARQLYAEIGLEADVQDCDDAIHNLLASSEASHRKTQNFFMRIWRWFKNLVRSLTSS